MKCKYCGEELVKGIEICKNCGRVNKSILNSGKFNKKIIIAAAAVAVAVIVALGTVFAIGGRNDIDVKLIDEAAGEYLLTNVPENYAFNIENAKGTKANELIVYDIYGNKANTENKVSENTITIGAPEGGYEKGEIYTLDLKGKGTFAEEEYRDAKKIIFVIEKKETTEVIYKDKVIETEAGTVKVKDDELTLEGEYKEGDIIVADTDDNDVDEIYKLVDVETKSGKTISRYTEASSDEVYETLDVFFYDDVNLKEATIDEEAFVGALDGMGVLDAFIDEAYAVSDIDVNIEVKKAGWKGANASYEFECVLKDPTDSKKQLTITFEVKDELLLKATKKLTMVNNSLDIASGLEFSVAGEDKAATEDSISKAIKNYKSNAGIEGSEGDYEVPLVPVTIPIFGPIAVYVDMGLTAEASFSAEFNAGIDTSVEFTQGVIYDIKKKEMTKKYADIDGDVEAYMMVHGKLDAFTGAYIDLGVEIPALIEVGIDAKGGPYLDAEGCFSIEGIPKDIQSKGYYYVEIGLMFKADAKVDLIGLEEKSYELMEKKKPLVEVSEHLSLVETSLKDTYYLSDEKVALGELTATYHDVITDEDITVPIEEYSLYVDDKKTSVTNGTIDKTFKEGEYTFKLKWKHEGDKFSDKKRVEISDFDPWGYFKEIEMFGTTLDSIEDDLIYLGNKDYGTIWQHFTDLGLSINDDPYELYSVPSKDISLYFSDYGSMNGVRCNVMGGTAKAVFGITSEVDIDTFIERLGIVYNGRANYDLRCTADIEHNNWYAYKGDELNYSLPGYSSGYGYFIRIYSEGLSGAYWYNNYDGLYMQNITTRNIKKYYGGCSEGFDKIGPATKVIVKLIPYGTDYY